MWCILFSMIRGISLRFSALLKDVAAAVLMKHLQSKQMWFILAHLIVLDCDQLIDFATNWPSMGLECQTIELREGVECRTQWQMSGFCFAFIVLKWLLESLKVKICQSSFSFLLFIFIWTLQDGRASQDTGLLQFWYKCFHLSIKQNTGSKTYSNPFKPMWASLSQNSSAKATP